MNSWLVYHNVTHEVYLREARQQRLAQQVQKQKDRPLRRPRRR